MKTTRRQFLGYIGAAGLGATLAPIHAGHAAESAPGVDLVFAAINDTHVVDEASTAFLDEAVRRINATPNLAFTLMLGDLSADAKPREFEIAKAHLDKLAKPYFYLPGNHDVRPEGEHPYANYDQFFPERQWCRRFQNWVFLGIDTCERTASDVTLPPNRVDWIRSQLKEVDPATPVVLCSHHPFNPHTKAYRVKNADEVLSLFSAHNLRMVLSGHYHGNQLEEAGGILFITTACCASSRDNADGTPAKGYRTFRITGADIAHDFMQCGG